MEITRGEYSTRSMAHVAGGSNNYVVGKG